MPETDVRTMPLVSPGSLCCSKKFISWLHTKREMGTWAKQLARQVPRGAKLTPAQQEVTDRLRADIAHGRELYFAHIDDTSLDHS